MNQQCNTIMQAAGPCGDMASYASRGSCGCNTCRCPSRDQCKSCTCCRKGCPRFSLDICEGETLIKQRTLIENKRLLPGCRDVIENSYQTTDGQVCEKTFVQQEPHLQTFYTIRDYVAGTPAARNSYNANIESIVEPHMTPASPWGKKPDCPFRDVVKVTNAVKDDHVLFALTNNATYSNNFKSEPAGGSVGGCGPRCGVGCGCRR